MTTGKIIKTIYKGIVKEVERLDFELARKCIITKIKESQLRDGDKNRYMQIVILQSTKEKLVNYLYKTILMVEVGYNSRSSTY